MIENGSRPASAEPRILALISGEPLEDPRVRWSADLCAEFGRCEVVGAVLSPPRLPREQVGAVWIDRVNAHLFAWKPMVTLMQTCSKLYGLPSARRFLARGGGGHHGADARPGRRALRRADHDIGGLLDFVADWSYYLLLASALYRRCRSISIQPSLVVCHDLYALIAAVRLKKRFGVPIVYDSHEFWPHADLLAQPWMVRFVGRLERRLLRHVDSVITVSPPLARALEREYGLPLVHVVPNAEPLPPDGLPPLHPPDGTVRFLLQGGASPGRGIDLLLEAWRQVSADAVLYIRCPENAYLASLRERFSDLTESGRVAFLPAVSESELVEAASFADVGIVPYVGPNLNHVYCCPNKLSQYMQAGLALLVNDLEFPKFLVQRHECGEVFQVERPKTLAAAVEMLVGDAPRLAKLKQNARDAVVREYNWGRQSEPYASEIRRLLAEAA